MLKILLLESKDGAVEMKDYNNHKITNIDILLLNRSLEADRDLYNSFQHYIVFANIPKREVGESAYTYEYRKQDYLKSHGPYYTKNYGHDEFEYFNQYGIFYDFILNIHESNNTSLNQRLMNDLYEYRRPILENPTIPYFIRDVSTETLQERKQRILDFIIGNFPIRMYNMMNTSLIGFTTYQDMINFQRNYINNLDDQQVQTLEFLFEKLLPLKSIIHGQKVENAISIIFTVKGEITLIYPTV